MPAQNPQTTTYAYRYRPELIQREHEEELHQHKKRPQGEGAVETTVPYAEYYSVGAATAPRGRSGIHPGKASMLTSAAQVLHMLSRRLQ